MSADKAKKYESDVTSFTTTTTTSYDRKNNTNGKKSSNVLPLERPRNSKAFPKIIENTNGIEKQFHTAELHTQGANETETGEIKSRMEAVLARMKSRTTTADVPSTDSTEETPVHGLLGEELERRRAAIIAVAREAEVHAREAADKFRLAESRLREETELRLAAEQRVGQIEQRIGQLEEESRQWLDTAQAEELRRLEVERAAELAKTELEERLKQEATARAVAEQARTEAEAKAETLQQALKEAEAKVLSAEEAARTAESLIYEADAIARKAEEKYQTAETNLQRETELRMLAEQMLKELASLNPHLELNWESLEAALAQASSAQGFTAMVSDGGQAMPEQIQKQIQDEQNARLEAEQLRTEAEAKAKELEVKLRKAEEKYRTTENGYKKVLRKQEEELRTMSEQVARNNDPNLAAAMDKSDSEVIFSGMAEANPMSAKIKLVSYGVFLTLLLLALGWLGIAAYRQL